MSVFLNYVHDGGPSPTNKFSVRIKYGNCEFIKYDVGIKYVGIQHSHERCMKSKAQDLNCGTFTCTENYKMKMSTQPIALHYKEEYLLSILFTTHIHKSALQGDRTNQRYNSGKAFRAELTLVALVCANWSILRSISWL